MQRDDFEVGRFPGLDAVGLDAVRPGATTGQLRVAIVTEEIIGPVRNGGIASTYYHLAKGLAARGHEVHVLFLKGPVVQDETPEHWVRTYADLGVTLHYLVPSEAPMLCSAPAWQRRYAGAYEWLRDQDPFDVVHTSEWRGGLVYALMAKRLGIAFADTLFLVKTSSPHIWNRHYQMQPITDHQLVAAAHAEQRCVELADLVVGGSAHLLSFMDRIGYRLPEGRVFVQPNVVDFSSLDVVDRRPGPRREPGDVVRTRDLVFFGRLEARKGIELFGAALDLLHERGEVPDSVTFLGKWGGRLSAHGGITPQEYVTEKAQTWACPVATVTDRNQSDALSYLCERDAIAVMPSLIENSSMAVYEALDRRVPFVASSVGGTPELVAEDDHDACLVEPTAVALADRLEEALRHGQVVASPRFSNDLNLEAWYDFHARLGGLVEQRGRGAAVALVTGGVDRPGTEVRTVGYLALVRRGDSLEDLLKGLHAEDPDEVVLGFTDASIRSELDRARSVLAETCAKVTVVNCAGLTSGSALDALVARQTCDAVVIAHGVGAVPRPGFLDVARRALTHRPGCLVTAFFTTDDATLGLPLGGDVASQVLTSRAYGPELVAVRRETLDRVGGFEPYDARQGLVHEYVTRAERSGHDLLVVPEPLLSWPSAVEDLRSLRSDPFYSYLKTKALLDDAELTQRKVLLSSLHGSTSGSGVLDERLLRGDPDNEAAAQWLMPTTWDPEDLTGVQHRRLVVGLDAVTNEVWFYARGPGVRRLLVRGHDEPVELVTEHGEPGTEEHVTLSRFRVPDSWDHGATYPLIWGLYDGDQKLRNTFLRINKIGTRTFTLSGRSAVLSSSALTELVAQRTAGWSSAPGPVALEPALDQTERDVLRAVAAAREFVERRAEADPGPVLERSRALLSSPPPTAPHPISPRSGLHPPHHREGWCLGDWLTGWAWDREDRDRTLHVAVVGDGVPLLVVAADRVDRSLGEVPGRERHAFRIPVLPDHLEAERVHLAIWEDRTRVYRGGLYIDQEAGPMLRRLRDQPVPEPGARARKRRWWSRL